MLSSCEDKWSLSLSAKTQKTHFLKILEWADFDLLESNCRHIFLHKNQKIYHSGFFFSWYIFWSHVYVHNLKTQHAGFTYDVVNSPPSFGVEADDFGNTRPVAFLKWQVVRFLSFSLSLSQEVGFSLYIVILTFTFSRCRFSLSLVVFIFTFSSDMFFTFSCHFHFHFLKR